MDEGVFQSPSSSVEAGLENRIFECNVNPLPLDYSVEESTPVLCPENKASFIPYVDQNVQWKDTEINKDISDDVVLDPHFMEIA